MLCITNAANISNTTPNIYGYMPEIIGIIGTILGTILGWLLHLISENMGRMHIYVDSFSELQSNQNEYACIVKLYIYNASHKQQCIRNARLSYRNNRGKVLFEDIAYEGECSFETVRSKNERKKNLGMISVNSLNQKELLFSNIIDGESYNKLPSVRKVDLVYEDKNNHKKKKLLKSNFYLDRVKKSSWEKFL